MRNTYHWTCLREMALCTIIASLLLREREWRCSITYASAMMLSTVPRKRSID